MDEKVRDTIIDDLLKKKTEDLIEVLDKSEKNSCDDTLETMNESLRYTDETLFNLNLHSYSDVNEYVRNRWFHGKSNWQLKRQRATVTRRTNRIWSKIKGPISLVQKTGRKGIYAVTVGYRSESMGHVFARNIDEAMTLVNIFFPKADAPYRVKFIDSGDIQKLKEYNLAVRERYANRINALQKQMHVSKISIVRLESLIILLSTLEAHQEAVEAKDASDEA